MFHLADMSIFRPPANDSCRWFPGTGFIVLTDVLAFAILVCLKLDGFLPDMSWYVLCGGGEEGGLDIP